MNRFVNGFFSMFGYKISKASSSRISGTATGTTQGIIFQNDRNFEIKFTPVTLDGDHYFLPKYALHRPAAQKLLNGEWYEPDTHDFVRDFCGYFSGAIVHAGTFFGDMIPSFSKSVSGNVYAFEPVLENYILAKLCVDSNNLSNVILMNAALSDNLCNLLIDTNQGDGKHAGGASTVSYGGSTICAAMSIDSLDIKDLILIQLDVEGHELFALQGAISTIRERRPVIALEDNHNNCSEFLHSVEYEKVGHIPGLTIWSPRSNNEYKKMITSFCSRLA